MPVFVQCRFEASLDSSFSPVCHRTRQQVKDRLCANPTPGAQADIDVVETLCELINDVSCVSPKCTSRVSVSVFSPSTTIDIENVQDVLNTPIERHDCEGSPRINLLHSPNIEEMVLNPTDLEVRDLYAETNSISSNSCVFNAAAVKYRNFGIQKS
ncbi:hypothetical protein CDAR_495231 [Caerostris darwini]|uniref:Uncharacterized protein n=1 Tax=Caerostris darwini TaxID=1538125 RepID=A0AAV4UXM8_9ARAC|nr:hypothetical protein CDAR_495231 [Caerostris darwini]